MSTTISGGGDAPSGWTPVSFITSWLGNGAYSEEQIEQYRNLTDNFANPPNFTLGPHPDDFTRMIWKEQQSMGCYAIECGPGTDYFNVHAGPGNPGNMGWVWQGICAFYPGKSLFFSS